MTITSTTPAACAGVSTTSSVFGASRGSYLLGLVVAVPKVTVAELRNPDPVSSIGVPPRVDPTFSEIDVTVGPAVTVVGPRVGAMGNGPELSLQPVKMSATETPTVDLIISGEHKPALSKFRLLVPVVDGNE